MTRTRTNSTLPAARLSGHRRLAGGCLAMDRYLAKVAHRGTHQGRSAAAGPPTHQRVALHAAGPEEGEAEPSVGAGHDVHMPRARHRGDRGQLPRAVARWGGQQQLPADRPGAADRRVRVVHILQVATERSWPSLDELSEPQPCNFSQVYPQTVEIPITRGRRRGPCPLGNGGAPPGRPAPRSWSLRRRTRCNETAGRRA